MIVTAFIQGFLEGFPSVCAGVLIVSTFEFPEFLASASWWVQTFSEEVSCAGARVLTLL